MFLFYANDVSFSCILYLLEGNKNYAISAQLSHITKHKCSKSQIKFLNDEIS